MVTWMFHLVWIVTIAIEGYRQLSSQWAHFIVCTHMKIHWTHVAVSYSLNKEEV